MDRPHYAKARAGTLPAFGVMRAALLAPSASIADAPGGARGNVVDDTGRPMVGVVVELAPQDGSERRTLRTDKHGFFGALGLEPLRTHKPWAPLNAVLRDPRAAL